MKNKPIMVLLFLTLLPGLISILFLSSCKKKSVAGLDPVQVAPSAAPVSTIYPGSYLPAYPGSYWVYNNGTGSTDSYTITTGANYVIDSVIISATMPGTTPTYTHAMVTVYNGQSLWGVRVPTYFSHSGGPSLTNLLIDINPKKGQTWETSRSFAATTSNYRVILAADTTLVVNGTTYNHVIATRDYTEVNSGSGIIIGNPGDKYYAKDVGMIAEYFYNDRFFRYISPTANIPADSAVSSFMLSKYYIKK